MTKSLTPGITLTVSKKVTQKDTAAVFGSGLLDVFSTPAMIALMEQTSMKAVEDLLDDGEGTVGTEVHIKHLRATPVGKDVTCTSVLTSVDGRRLIFDVQAYDNNGKIGEGTHERFIINNERFMEKISNLW
jgi:fluoroacetyl-CoA thioesterase